MEDSQMQDKTLNEKESLALIAQMIQNSQKRLERGAGGQMLVWGYATIFATIAVWVAFHLTGNYNWNFLWFLIPVIGYPYIVFKSRQPKLVKTYIDKVIRYIWMVVGITGFFLSAATIFSFMWAFPILFVVILMMGMGSMLTGLVTEFKPSVIGSLVGILIGFVNYLVPDYDVKMLTFALAFICIDIIPGHILNYRAQKRCSKN
ncbi:hypothetical protein [Paludibacter jiangxiensis]|uniref:Uncharacterized protein n=1 Tax=Paludibacter jiangxiensis TaxID=681398 RepID=A0A170YNT9_9BACT|nr:hypothetical protein [Paludibacter jiangxiensis]GAT61942.1 hypothetical protein PJIAN_1531 [Paludibacter jiangxiensis]